MNGISDAELYTWVNFILPQLYVILFALILRYGNFVSIFNTHNSRWFAAAVSREGTGAHSPRLRRARQSDRRPRCPALAAQGKEDSRGEGAARGEGADRGRAWGMQNPT